MIHVFTGHTRSPALKYNTYIPLGSVFIPRVPVLYMICSTTSNMPTGKGGKCLEKSEPKPSNFFFLKRNSKNAATITRSLCWVYLRMGNISEVKVENSSRKAYIRDEKMKWAKTSIKVSVLGVVPLRIFRKTLILTL